MGKNHQPDVREYDSSTDSSEEKSSPTAPSRSCQHLKKSVDSSKLRKYLKATGLLLECPQCQKMNACMSTGETLDSSDAVGSFEYDNTLWLCLKCGTQLCGRNKNKHALQHFEVCNAKLKKEKALRSSNSFCSITDSPFRFSCFNHEHSFV